MTVGLFCLVQGDMGRVASACRLGTRCWTGVRVPAGRSVELNRGVVSLGLWRIRRVDRGGMDRMLCQRTVRGGSMAGHELVARRALSCART